MSDHAGVGYASSEGASGGQAGGAEPGRGRHGATRAVLAALWLIPLSPVLSVLVFLGSFAVRPPARAVKASRPAGWLWALWLAAVAASAWLAPRPDVAWAGAVACLAFVLVLQAVARALPGPEEVQKGLRVLFWGTVPWALLGIGFALARREWLWTWGPLQLHVGTWDNRANSVFLHPNALAGYLVFAIAASLVFRSRMLRFGAGLLVLVACQVLTQSRAGLLGTAAVLAASAALSRLPALRAGVATSGASGGGWRTWWPWALGGALAIGLMPAVLRRLGDLLDPSDQSTLGRLYAWGAAGKMISGRPVFGWGPGGWGTAYPAFRDPAEHEGLVHAHSLPLHLSAEIGVLPTALFFAAIAATVVLAIRCAAGRPEAAARQVVALTAGLVGYFTLGLFDVVATEGRNALAFAAVLGLLAALGRGEGAVVDGERAGSHLLPGERERTPARPLG